MFYFFNTKQIIIIFSFFYSNRVFANAFLIQFIVIVYPSAILLCVCVCIKLISLQSLWNFLIKILFTQYFLDCSHANYIDYRTCNYQVLIVFTFSINLKGQILLPHLNCAYKIIKLEILFKTYIKKIHLSYICF